MATWWYFKNVSIKTAPLNEQTEAANSIMLDQRYWLGYHPHASLQDCQDITKLVYTTNDIANRRNPKTRPINKCDDVWVYNLACLGQHIHKVKEVLDMFHKNQIALHIYTIGYYDDCNADKTRNDYALLSSALNELGERIFQRSAMKKFEDPSTPHKKGRPPVVIHLDNLNTAGKRIIEKFCLDSSYSPVDAHEDLRAQTSNFKPPVNGISRKKFYELVNEYDSMLEAQGKEFFRSRSLLDKNS